MTGHFNLYQSGILRAAFLLDNDSVLVEELDARTLKMGAAARLTRLTPDKIRELKKNYSLDVGFILSNLEVFGKDFKNAGDSVESLGQSYEKYIEKEGVVVFAGRKGANPVDITLCHGEPAAFTACARDAVSVLVKEGFEKATSLSLWDGAGISRAEYPVVPLGTAMVPMRDGVKLATEIWKPDTDEKVPAILVRTPYGRLGKVNEYYRFVMRGYAVCIQDVRGQGDSEGEYVPKFYEKNDGYDTLEFLAAQPFCSGIGMFGGSYLGDTQWSAAASGSPHLKALVSIVTAGDSFTDLPRKGGALASGTMAWAFSVKEKQFDKGIMERLDWPKIMKMRPIRDIPEMVFGEPIGFWSKWCSHEKYDDFWEACNWHAQKDSLRVPALIVSGWYDDNGMATTQALEIAETYSPADKKVVLGPWIHVGNGHREVHGVGFGNNALRYDLDLLYQQWFDYRLKGMKNPIAEGDRVEYYSVGENLWKTCNHWPPENSCPVDLYLSSGGKANSSLGNGKLFFAAPIDEGFDSYSFDPENPAPHIIDPAENELCVPEDYTEMEKRDDVLVYTSAPMEEDFAIAGDLYVEFYAESSAPDTDWVVRVTDVDEAGRSVRLCDGLLRAKFRNGFDRMDLLVPGKIEKYGIRTTKIAVCFHKGHRIRLQITSGAENYIFPNPNTGNNFFEDTQSEIAKQKIHHGGAHLSKVVLPAVKAPAL